MSGTGYDEWHGYDAWRTRSDRDEYPDEGTPPPACQACGTRYGMAPWGQRCCVQCARLGR